jgi:hypothetical protein
MQLLNAMNCMEGIMIMEIIYENEFAKLKFDYHMVVESLQRRIRSYQVPDDFKLLQFIQQTSKSNITINGDHPLADRFIFLIFDLISNGQGTAYCKSCNRKFSATYLTINETSSIQKTTITNKLKKLLMREFDMKGPVNIPGLGMKQLLCPENHVLLSVRSWIT